MPKPKIISSHPKQPELTDGTMKLISEFLSNQICNPDRETIDKFGLDRHEHYILDIETTSLDPTEKEAEVFLIGLLPFSIQKTPSGNSMVYNVIPNHPVYFTSIFQDINEEAILELFFDFLFNHKTIEELQNPDYAEYHPSKYFPHKSYHRGNLIGYNVIDFDIYYLCIRAMKYSIHTSTIFSDYCSIDLMQVLTPRKGKFKSRADWCSYLGIEVSPTCPSSEMPEKYKLLRSTPIKDEIESMRSDLTQHLLNDLVSEFALFRRCHVSGLLTI